MIELIFEILFGTIFDIIYIILGAIFGSFSTFVGYRLFNEDKKNYSLLGIHSKCCNCGHNLKVIDLIPIISFILLKGKCRYCKKPIPAWHFIAELFCSFSFVYSIKIFNGINYQSILFITICICLCIQSITDIRKMVSSDIIHIIIFICSFMLSNSFGYTYKQSLLTFFFIFVFFISLTFLMKILLKKDCLGFGDIKLFSSLSMVFSIEQFALFIGFTGIFGIIFFIIREKMFKTNNNKKEIPYIPIITFAFLLAFYFKVKNLL